MITQNIEITNKARQSLSGNWVLAISTCVVYIIITSLPNNMDGFGTISSLIISGPFAVGLALFSLSLSRRKKAKFNQIFKGFRLFSTAFKAHFLILVFVILKLFLLIIPGIFAALSYSVTFYVLADNPSLTAKQAMKQSEKMMFGHRFQLVNMALHFLGLALLCIVTLGIGFLWWFPYVNVSMAKFYDEVKNDYYEEIKCF